MDSESGSGFTVDCLPHVVKRIKELAKQAKAQGTRKEFSDALTAIYEKLETGPLACGDPEYHPKSKGSTVCHGLHGPLNVRYVVFEPEHIVVILQIKPLPNSNLQ